MHSYIYFFTSLKLHCFGPLKTKMKNEMKPSVRSAASMIHGSRQLQGREGAECHDSTIGEGARSIDQLMIESASRLLSVGLDGFLRRPHLMTGARFPRPFVWPCSRGGFSQMGLLVFFLVGKWF